MTYKVSVIIPCYNAENTIARSIESVPKECQIVFVNDGSTDESRNRAEKALMKKSWPFGPDIKIVCKDNGGVASAVNTGLDIADGEYVVLLGADDYFYVDEFEKAMKHLDGTDIVYFDLQINNGAIFHLEENTKEIYCGSTKFIRRDFIGDTREPEDKRAGEDYYFYKDLLAKNPTEKFTNLVVKHYNFPRDGSLSDRLRKGEI